MAQPSVIPRTADGHTPGAGPHDWPELPGSRREVESIAASFDPERVEILCGEDATAERLDALLASGRLRTFSNVHFATHARIEPEAPLSSALLLGNRPRPVAPESATGGHGGGGGRLTAGEVMRGWRLDADLVVLSACETALGKPAGGEGFLGFVQAFLIAGARSVVVSLWKVDDGATALLMTRFYENLMLGKRNKADALVAAKEWLRSLPFDSALSWLARRWEVPSRRGVDTDAFLPELRARGRLPFAHPYYWAGFVLFEVGPPEFRRRPPAAATPAAT